jgi:uncharacterized protein YegP (UPF0339 family)
MNRFEAFEDLSDKWRWRLIAANGRVVATSGESFDSHADALGAATTVRGLASASGIEAEPGRSWKAAIGRLIRTEEERRVKASVAAVRRPARLRRTQTGRGRLRAVK